MSIPHLEDLPAYKLLTVLDTFRDYEATEKLDGSQLLFGLDEDGFYTSRETKGGLRIYNVDDYELNFKNTYIRSAHIALESALPLLKEAGLTIGCQFEVEVLYGEFPNVVQYSPDKNFIIFLRPTEGHVNIDHIRVKLAGQSLTVPLVAPFTNNGKTIEYSEISNVWEFAVAPQIPFYVGINGYRNKIRKFLATTYLDVTVLDLLSAPMNKRPVWLSANTSMTSLKIDKDRFSEELKTLVLEFKEMLLTKVVRNRVSMFGPDNGWIEGVVFRNPKTEHMFKLVDKDVFLVIKDFLWEERKKIFSIKEHNEQDLDARLDKYEKEKDHLSIKIKPKGVTNGFICAKYNEYIDRRTKEIYATLYQKVKDAELNEVK